MLKRQRFTFLAIGGLGLMAAVGPGLAATIATPEGQAVPAAGQGDVQVLGYTVSDIAWTFVSNSTDVDEVSFTIKRGNGDTPVTSTNTTVRARLENRTPDPAETTEWQDCTVDAVGDAATCSFTGDTMAADAVEFVNVVAFDK